MATKFYTPVEAAESLGISRQLINYHLRRGTLETCPVGPPTQLIPAKSLERLRKKIKGTEHKVPSKRQNSAETQVGS